jgi:two-component system chemotaxis response regulator CheV
MQDKLHVEHVENPLGVDREAQRVMLVEDSHFIRNLIEKVLVASGYEQVETHLNGQDAWHALQQQVANQEQTPSIIITDIEMPQLDGLALTRHIKDQPELKNTPVVLFSSLITEDTRHKGNQVGADKQIAKPQLPELVGIIDNLISPQPEAVAA